MVFCVRDSTWMVVLVMVGASLALFLYWDFLTTCNVKSLHSFNQEQTTMPLPPKAEERPNERWEESTQNFYRDPKFGYTMGNPLKHWSKKRQAWLKYHTMGRDTTSRRPRILLLSGSQSQPCNNPIGDHLQLRALKNKQDYCRLHGIEMFYNTALFDPKMITFWAKIPLIRAAMAAHPEAEWLWWMDSDAIITDMEYEHPLERYADFNFVVHGWEDLVYKKKSWVAINAGVFLIRNCEWSMEFMDRWASMGPTSPLYSAMAHMLSDVLPDRVVTDSDDQSALVYLMIKEKKKWCDKIYVENSYYFQGYWVDIVGNFENFKKRYEELEMRNTSLTMRYAEKDSRVLWNLKEDALRRAGLDGVLQRRPFVTHFTGCQPCSGNHNKAYKGQDCWDGMIRALDFADDQVLRVYGFRKRDLQSDHIVPF